MGLDGSFGLGGADSLPAAARRRGEPVHDGLSMRAAIVIPVLNQLAFTQGCLRDLKADLDAGVPVVVVDNGSTDGSAAWLAAQPGITVLRNEDNRGCAPAWNQGVRAVGALAADGEPPAGRTNRVSGAGGGPEGPEWVVVLNNDVRLPQGWLAALLGAAERFQLDIACPAMRERDLNYDLGAHARDFTARLAGVVRRGAAHGVCFAVRRAVFARIGGFDEAFRLGQFEDADFFRRARVAGFRTGMVGACFLHHFGSVTQDALSDASRQRPYEAENRAHFRRKWRLGWMRRRLEKTAEALRLWRWRSAESRRFGSTLHEKWDGRRWRQL